MSLNSAVLRITHLCIFSRKLCYFSLVCIVVVAQQQILVSAQDGSEGVWISEVDHIKSVFLDEFIGELIFENKEYMHS